MCFITFTHLFTYSLFFLLFLFLLFIHFLFILPIYLVFANVFIYVCICLDVKLFIYFILLFF